MRPFAYQRATDVAGAAAVLDGRHRAIAGGTNLVDLIKADVMRPAGLVDISRLPLAEITETTAGGLRLGALATNAATAHDPRVAARYPLLAQAILAGASPQLRNMATDGGNLLQRTRCYYFYDTATPCNKRAPGTGCSALAGINRIHAVLGASDSCIAVHPSDMCVALAALDAVVHVEGRRGARQIMFADFHRLPGNAPEQDTTLAADELIVAIELPAEGFAAHASYLKIRDRNAYAFALVSVAAALALDDGGAIRDVRVALGGVAHKPWRDRAAERAVIGRPADDAAFGAIAEALLRDAVPRTHNAFKIPLARRAIARALRDARGAS